MIAVQAPLQINKCWWLVMMTVIVGMNNVKIIILTKPISYLKQKKQSMDSCVILKIHYSKSALYISGRVLFSLFSVLWCVDDGQWLRLWWGPVGGLCPKCALWGLMQLHRNSSGPVSALPVDVWGFGQSVQCIPWAIRYKVWNAQPPCWSSGTGSLGCTSMWWRVFSGQKTTLMANCVRIRLTASERPLM